MKPFDVYSLFNIEIERGKGCYIYDYYDNEYLDLYGGQAVISIGHNHPHYLMKVTEQLNKIAFYSNSVLNPLQVQLANKLGKQSSYEDYSLFMLNSGTEANENALKLASFHNQRKKILSFKNSFHGRTATAGQVTDILQFSAPISKEIEVTFVALNDIESVRKELLTQEYSAVIIEGIQGVGGVHIPENEFLVELRKICTETSTILIIDEIESGYGRSGKFFAHQFSGIKADIITIAKGMGNGFPVAGILIHPQFEEVKELLGSTFGGSYLACTASIAVLDILEAEQSIENAKNIGSFLMEELRNMGGIKEVRGRGLMIGIEFNNPVEEKRLKLLENEKIFTDFSGTHIIKLLPPLSFSKSQAEYFLDKFKKIVN